MRIRERMNMLYNLQKKEKFVITIKRLRVSIFWNNSHFGIVAK